MYDNVVALYCITDDLLKAINHIDDCRCELSDAEVITTALTATLYFGGNLEHARSFVSPQSAYSLDRCGSNRPYTRYCRIQQSYPQLGGPHVFQQNHYGWQLGTRPGTSALAQRHPCL